MYIIDFVHCLFSSRVREIFCTCVYLFCLLRNMVMQNSNSDNSQNVPSFNVCNQYLMKNSLVILSILKILIRVENGFLGLKMDF